MFFNNKKIKTFISLFIFTVIVLSLVLSKTDEDLYYAAPTLIPSTTKKTTTETTKRRTVGHKVEGAEYYDELWEKFSVIAVDNGGGSGEGGGAGDNDAQNAGNNGAYNDSGGVFGQAAGIGQGVGSKQNQSGTGAGTTGGSTGSATADAYRKLRADIEESKAESLAKVLETAANAQAMAASIAARESEQASIQRRLKQESIKASIEAAELQRQMFYETPVYVEAAVRQNTYVADVETRMPTSVRRDSFGAFDNKIPPSRTPTMPRTKAVETSRSNIIIREETLAPLSNEITLYDAGNIVPSEESALQDDYTNYISLPTAVDNQTYYENSEMNMPTSAPEEYTEATETLATLETFDTPIVEEPTSIIVEEEITTEAYTAQTETEVLSDTEEGKGSKGGKDAEADEDMTGDAGENESQGNADEKGKYQLETKGEFAGKKVFELKQNGNFGFEPEHLSIAGLKNFMTSVLTLLIMIGALLFVFSTKDKNRGYF